MGALEGSILHLVNNNDCKMVLVLQDDSDVQDEYKTVVQGQLLRRGLLGVLDSAARDGKLKFESTATEDDTWHFPGECPF